MVILLKYSKTIIINGKKIWFYTYEKFRWTACAESALGKNDLRIASSKLKKFLLTLTKTPKQKSFDSEQVP